jgi:hypothetical protein
MWNFEMPGFCYDDSEESIAFNSLEELSQYFEPKQIYLWCEGNHDYAACPVIRSTGSIGNSVLTSIKQTRYEQQDPYINYPDWGNFQNLSCNDFTNKPHHQQKSSLEEMMERLEESTKKFLKVSRVGYNIEASTWEPMQDEYEEQVFEDCSEEEVEYDWKQIEENIWRLESMKRTHKTPIELHTEEETTCENCWKKLSASRKKETAAQPLRRLASRPSGDSDSEVETSISTEPIDDPEPICLESLVFKPRVPFARKRLDLSIYTFEESDDEHIFEEARNTVTKDAACEKEYKDGEKFVRTKFREHRPKLKRVKSKEERSHSKQTKKLSSSKRPLKRTHWNSGKRSRGRNRNT